MSLSDEQKFLFSDYFGIDKRVVDDYGAFNISLLSDLPLFIDPFLLFSSSKEEYKALHSDIIEYLRFLRDKSVSSAVSRGDLINWYHFKEVKQTWLGFSFEGNSGRGLGPKFANALNSNFHRLFSESSGTQITQGRHLEKLCLIQKGVGKDNISDFTTNLIKGYLLSYTEKFARLYLDPKRCRSGRVDKVKFNYELENWSTADFYLPVFEDNFIILTPQDLLTSDETWLNRNDLINSFGGVSASMPNEGLRSQINNYLEKILPANPTPDEKRKAVEEAIYEYPDFIDYYIREKENRGIEAEWSSARKVNYAKSVFLGKFVHLAKLVRSQSDFDQYAFDKLPDVLDRVQCLKEVIETKGGHAFLFNDEQKPISSEEELRLAKIFIWAIPSSIKSENRQEIISVDFKLASNSNIKKYLEKKDEEAVKEEKENAKPRHKITVVFVFNPGDKFMIEGYISELKSKSHHVRIINASGEAQSKETEVLTEEKTPTHVSATTSELQSMTTNPTPIFICYAHKDNESASHQGRWLDRLLEHLTPLMDEEFIQAWSDKELEMGDEWDANIKKGLQSAKVAILLVSPALLASKYIRNSEIPVLLQKSKEQGVAIIPIIVSHCLFDQATFKYPDPKTGPEKMKLSIFQAANSPSQPLKDVTDGEQDRVLDSVARKIRKLIDQDPQ